MAARGSGKVDRLAGMSSLSQGNVDSRPEARVLALLSGLFFLRVVGQFLVANRKARFLPPMEQWQSGLLPYPVLLFFQGLILALQAAIGAQARRGQGALVVERPRFGRLVRRFSVAYFAGMVARYVISMTRFPERRWFGKTIPIIFHCLLATYLYVYARVVTRGTM